MRQHVRLVAPTVPPASLRPVAPTVQSTSVRGRAMDRLVGKACVDDSPPTGKSAPRTFPWWRLAGSALALTLLLHFLPREALWAAMRRLSPALWLLVLAGYLGTHVVGILKWRLLLRLAGAELSFAAAARCYAAGLFGNLFLPSVVGGDVVRAGLAMRLTRERTGVLCGSLLDRMLDAASLGSVALVGALSLHRGLDAQSRALLGLLGALLLVALALFLLLRGRSERSATGAPRRQLDALREVARAIARRPGSVLLGLGYGIAVQLFLVALTAGIGAACGVRVSLGVWLFAWPLAKLAGMLPVTQGGIGVREAALAALLVPFGASAAAGVAAGLVWETVLLAGGLLCGLGTLVAGHHR
jgi:glycosyltransferase 2 family protein